MRIVTLLRCSGQHSAQQVTDQLRRRGWQRPTGYDTDGGHGQCPDGQRFAVIIGRAGDLQCVGVFLQVPGKGSKSIPQEEPHREPRGIGGQPQHIKMLIRRKLFFKERHGLPGGQPPERRLHIRFLDAGSFLCTKQEQAERILIRRLRTLGPADDGGVTHALAVVPVCDQQVQRGGVGKGGVLAHGSILALLVAVGVSGRILKGYKSTASRLCTGDTLNIGMD